MDRNAQVRETVRQLPTMDRAELAELWEKNFGHPPTKKLRPELMRPVLAFRVQELAYGGFTSNTNRRLKEIAQSLHPGGRTIDEARNRFKPGTRIIREWGGKTHEVQIAPNGYHYNGKVYKSLSPIATEITGTKWSGPAFFGTKRSGGAQ